MSRKYLALCTIVYLHMGTKKRISAKPNDVVDGIDPNVAADLVQEMRLRPLSRGELLDRGVPDDYDHDAGAQHGQIQAAVSQTVNDAGDGDAGDGDAGDGDGDGDGDVAENGSAGEAGGEAAAGEAGGENEAAGAEEPKTRRRRSATAGV